MNKHFALAAVALAIGTAPVLAADPPGLVLVDDTPSATSAWDGFYAGVLTGIWNGNNFYLLGGASLGANFTVAPGFVLGIEGRGAIYSDGDLGGDVTGRLGGTFDQVLLYADGGVGIRDGAPHLFVGAGAELALMDNLSLDGRAEFVTGAGFNAIRATAALNFHF